MKGTLFSSDFAVDGSDNLRLLEINTDTGIASASFQHFDFSPLYTTWTDNSISELHIIYKDHQKEFVEFFSSSVVNDYSGTIGIDLHIEEGNTIYPYTITDAADKFILRLAYDEAAILDSTYAKNSLNLLDLFYDNNATASIATYYHSGSDGVVDILERDFNSSVMPDIVVKDTTTTMYAPLKFYKIGHSASGSDDRFTNFIDDIKSEDTLIQNYYENIADNKATSTRVYSVVYGTDLDLATLAYTETEAVLEKPTSIEATDAEIAHHLGNHHYFEYATNTPVFGVGTDYGGILEEEEIISASGDSVAIPSASVGGIFKSYFISGSPDTDLAIEYLDWSFPGSTLPSGSYVTSSVLINNVRQPLPYGIMFNLTPSGSDPIRISGASSVDIVSNEAEVYTGDNFTHVLDLEETDTFFLADENAHIKIVSHNCFVAGTQIHLADGGLKVIEDIQSGDQILTVNMDTYRPEAGTVGSVKSSQVDNLIKITYAGKEILTTPLHKFRVPSKTEEYGGWVPAQNIEIGDKLALRAQFGTLDELDALVTNIEIIEGETYRQNDFNTSQEIKAFQIQDNKLIELELNQT